MTEQDHSKEVESTPERSIELFHPDLSVLPPRPTLPAGYRLRTWQDGDETKVPPILGDAFFGYPEMGTYESFHRFLARRGGLIPENIFVIEGASGEAVGTMTARFESPQVGRLHRVGVRPNHQGRGLGKVLAIRALQHLAECGAKTAYVQTESNRPAAISVYLWAGFQPVLDPARFFELRNEIPPYDLGETWDQIYEQLAAFRMDRWEKCYD
jgi:GNAT superfamily N-acetyltransferase